MNPHERISAARSATQPHATSAPTAPPAICDSEPTPAPTKQEIEPMNRTATNSSIAQPLLQRTWRSTVGAACEVFACAMTQPFPFLPPASPRGDQFDIIMIAK